MSLLTTLAASAAPTSVIGAGGPALASGAMSGSVGQLDIVVPDKSTNNGSSSLTLIGQMAPAPTPQPTYYTPITCTLI